MNELSDPITGVECPVLDSCMKASQGSSTNDVSPANCKRVKFQTVSEGTPCVVPATHGMTDEGTLSNVNDLNIDGDTSHYLVGTISNNSHVKNLLGSSPNSYKAKNIGKVGELSRNSFSPTEGGAIYDNTNKMGNVSRNQSEPFQSTPPAFFSLEEGRVTPNDTSRVKGGGVPIWEKG